MKKIRLVHRGLLSIIFVCNVSFLLLIIVMLLPSIRQSWDWGLIEFVVLIVCAIAFMITFYYCLRLKLVLDYSNRQIILSAIFKNVKISFDAIESFSVGRTTSLDFNTFHHLRIHLKLQPVMPMKLSLSFFALTKKTFNRKKENLLEDLNKIILKEK